MVITLLATLGFILPVDSGEKVSLEVTVLLSLTVLQLLVADKLPPSAESTPWIGHFFSFTLFLCGLSTFIQVVVINIHHRGDRRMPVWMKKSILKPLCVITLTKAHWQDNKKDDDKSSNTGDGTVPVEELDNKRLWEMLSICIDRVGLVVFSVTFTIGCIIIFANFA